jgi:hypothetical protein
MIVIHPMVVIRCTQKLLKRVGAPHGGDVTSTTRLGDWYANLVVIDRRPLVLLVSERSRLPVVFPARRVKLLGAHLPGILQDVLEALGIPAPAIAREVGEMRETVIAPTDSRSVLGTLNEFTVMLRHRLYSEPDADLIEVAAWLSETPIMALGNFFPDVKTRELLC